MPNEPTPDSAANQPTALQQLEAALAAGHLTPEVFATLRAQLPPATPTAPPAPKVVFSPSDPDKELPSLLDMFNQLPAAPATPPAPASPPQPAPADAAARQLIEERLAQIRQRPTTEPTPPKPASTPPPTFLPEPVSPKPAYTPPPTFLPEPVPPKPAYTPPPTFLPEPPAPTFYPSNSVVETASPPPARPSTPPTPPASSSTSGRWLLVLLGLAIVGALAYFFIQNSHPDETLTSPSLPAATAMPKRVDAPKTPKRAKKSSKKKHKAKHLALPAAAPTPTEATDNETTAVAEAVPAVVAEAPAAGTRHSPPAAPEAGDDAATIKIRTIMAAYYADLLAPPLHASQYFAPQVERLYIQQNLTPAAIDAELARSFFPENQQAIARIEPGTLRVSAPAADGSRTATFTETMRLYRVSLRKNQQLRTQVRVRFNADYQIVYMRQEKLLSNTFEE